MKAINHMKKGKATGSSGVIIEMICASGKEMFKPITNLANHIVRKEEIPDEWNMSYINCYKGKGDTLDHGNSCGLSCLSSC